MSVNRLWGAPLLRVEMRTRMRDWRSFGLLTGYLGTLAIVEGTFLLQDDSSIAGSPLPLGVQLFDRLALAQLVLVFLLTPLVMAGAASGERERGTWDLLMATPLSPFGIVISKVAARFLFLLSMLASGLPLVGVAFLYGDVSASDALPTYVVLLGTMLVLGAFSMVISMVARNRLPDLAGSAVVSLLLGVGLTLLVARGGNATWHPFELPATSSPVKLPAFSQISAFAALDSAVPLSHMRTTTGDTLGLAGRFDVWLSYGIIACLASLLLLLEAIRRIRPSGATSRGWRAEQT